MQQIIPNYGSSGDKLSFDYCHRFLFRRPPVLTREADNTWKEKKAPINARWIYPIIDLNANHWQELFLGYLCPQAARGTQPAWDINRVLSTLPPTASLCKSSPAISYIRHGESISPSTLLLYGTPTGRTVVFFSKSRLKLFLGCWYKENSKRSTYYRVIHLFMCQILHWNFISPSLVFSPEIPRQHITARYHTAWQKAV